MMSENDDFEPVFLLAGQSNMSGRCDGEDLPRWHPCYTKNNNKEADAEDDKAAAAAISAVMQFTLRWDNDCNFGVENGSHSSGEWRPLQCQYSPGLQRHLFGPEMGLAESLGRRIMEQRLLLEGGGKVVVEEEGATTSTRPLHVLKFAMGSTNLHSNWNPSNTNDDHPKPNQKAYFRRFIEFCQSGLAEEDATNDGAPPRKKKLVGMFWLQGEGDSTKAKDANAYLTNLQSFIDAVRHELDAPNVPIVVSPIVWKGKYAYVINQALKDAGSGAVRNCICIDQLDASKLGVQQSGELAPDHLTAEAILDIGRRMGESFPMDLIK